MKTTQLIHGGQLNEIAKDYQISKEQWLDLSTGIAPFSYPIEEIPLSYWQELPQTDSQLLSAAKNYYQTKHCMPCHGSQSVITCLPVLWRKKNPKACHVYLPAVGYKEHQKAWLNAGFTVDYYHDELPYDVALNSVTVVINPNNPSGNVFSQQELLAFHQQCEHKQSLLVVDEAFMDVVNPSQSLAPSVEGEHLIVLRSFGKFFGLAGLRIGFVCASELWLECMAEEFGPWHTNGPAQFIAGLAFKDFQWHKNQRALLNKQSNKLAQTLKQYVSSELAVCPLFITAYLNNPQEVYQQLCANGVYVRLTDEQNSLRFGIATDKQLERLTNILEAIKQN